MDEAKRRSARTKAPKTTSVTEGEQVTIIGYIGEKYALAPNDGGPSALMAFVYVSSNGGHVKFVGDADMWVVRADGPQMIATLEGFNKTDLARIVGRFEPMPDTPVEQFKGAIQITSATLIERGDRIVFQITAEEEELLKAKQQRKKDEPRRVDDGLPPFIFERHLDIEAAHGLTLAGRLASDFLREREMTQAEKDEIKNIFRLLQRHPPTDHNFYFLWRPGDEVERDIFNRNQPPDDVLIKAIAARMKRCYFFVLRADPHHTIATYQPDDTALADAMGRQ